ncbi:MAG: thioesterase domain-containing protein [Acetobacteraceae bacterium]
MHYHASAVASAVGPAERTGAAGPTNSVATIADIFARVLRILPIDADADFFALGGDSLTATALALEIEAAFDVSMRVTSLFDTPTPATLAAAIARYRTPNRSPLVLLRAGSGAPPLFLVPAAGGWPTMFGRIATRIDISCPIYGFLAPGLDGTEPPLARIEQLAEHFLPAIRSVQPRGPYFLGGYSMGGLTALELAQMLTAAGEEVAVLALFDTYICPRRLCWTSKLAVWRRRVSHHSAILQNIRWHAWLPFALARCRSLLGDVGIAPRPSPGMPRLEDPAVTPAMRRVAQAGLAAAVAYRPRFYAGTITYFEASNSDMMPAYPDLTWRRLARKLVVHRIQGDHWQMMLGQGEETAQQLAECVRTARAATGTSASPCRPLRPGARQSPPTARAANGPLMTVAARRRCRTP